MAKGWTQADIDKLKAKGAKVTETKTTSTGPAKKLKKACEKVPKAVQFIKETLENAGIVYETEYKFHAQRKFRFDFAIIDKKLAIEYEGLISEKSRHTTIEGYSRDSTKYNLAQLAGWRVLRYTAVNYRDFENDMKSIVDES